MSHSTTAAFVLRCSGLLFVCAAQSSLFADTTTETLAAKLQPLIDRHDGDVGVCVQHLTSGVKFQHRPDAVMPTASLIKLPVMIEAYRQADAGTIDLNSMLTLHDSDKVPGSGILTTHFSDGMQLSLRDAIRLMIAYSDNTATNLVVDAIGMKATAETMEKMGFPETKLHSKVYRGSSSVFPKRSQQYGLGSTTAADIAALLQQLHEGKLVSPKACDDMKAHLLACDDKKKLPRFLPAGVKVAHKTGSVSKSRCAAGLMYTRSGPIAICVLTSNNKDTSWGDKNAGDLLCSHIAKAACDYFNPRGTSGAPQRELQEGDFGELVEALQRTLNVRMTPSPDLSVDGDFGPATAAVVTKFQNARSLKATGIVASDTWAALSPLLTEATPVPEPDVVNAEQLPIEPADKLTGPPIVSCEAWAIADAATGDVLWEHRGEESLPMASTTKIMTAYVVLKLAEADAKVLDETVVFSGRADRTRGSTSGIREGESLSVRELLYGLLLPSGNDASVALGEHFGGRLSDSTSQDATTSTDPLASFVAAMNAAASELGMTQTAFVNTHGLSAANHHSSAADLCKLAKAALSLPLFRQYVETRQRGCTVTSAAGYSRNVMWKNTNRLLGITGFHGVKTGTTSDAGACLVSKGSRGDRELILTVLGAKSSTGRYVDTRNLYRWAWNELQTETSLP